MEPGDRRHYRKTTLTYLRGYAVDETPPHADVEPPQEAHGRRKTELVSKDQTLVPHSSSGSDCGPKWVQNDKKVNDKLPAKSFKSSSLLQ